MKRLHISFNAPATLGFVLLCLVAMLGNILTGGWCNLKLFSVYHSPLSDPLSFFRFFGHVLGHANWTHLVNNMMYILLLGPLLEEKYGTSNIIFIILLTALITGLVNYIFFPYTQLLGASGVVFAMILLSSFSCAKGRELPLTFILVAILYLGEQVYQLVTVQDSISQTSHVIGGTIGALFGFLMNHNTHKRHGKRSA